MSIESKEFTMIDPRQLVRWLGLEGARAGLLQSKLITVQTLMQIAKSMGITASGSKTRQQLVEAIIKVASKRIDKPIDELYRMDRDELIQYFERVEPTSEELRDLLRSLDINPRKEGHRSLMVLAARELSETGRFIRISTSVSKH